MLIIKNVKRWFNIHKWTSLICTIFLLLLCVTGLPLVFEEEIDELQHGKNVYEQLPAGTPLANIDSMVQTSVKENPSKIVTSIFIDDEEPQVIISMSTSWAEDEKQASDSNLFTRYDARTGKVLERSKPFSEQPADFMSIMLSLHRDMFAGLFGELFLAVMGLLFVVALVSGFVLYGPFMKKLDFGAIRTRKSKRLKWLDLHNLSGIVVLAWMAVVGITGVMNELSTPLFGLWQATDVNRMLESYAGKPMPQPASLPSVQQAVDTAQKAVPGMTVTSIVYPGAPFGSPRHYLLWAKGNTPLQSRLFSPVLVDANTGCLSAIVKMPWYLRTLEVSRPLHFGDYGGLPLKILWAAFDIIAIVVLISGTYLWFARRKSKEEWPQKILESNE